MEGVEALVDPERQLLPAPHALQRRVVRKVIPELLGELVVDVEASDERWPILERVVRAENEVADRLVEGKLLLLVTTNPRLASEQLLNDLDVGERYLLLEWIFQPFRPNLVPACGLRVLSERSVRTVDVE